jgi:hypothetical protein
MEAVVAEVLAVQAQVTIQDPPPVKEVMCIAIGQAILPVRLSVPKLARALLETAVLLVIANHIVMDTNMQVVEVAEGTYRELPIQHIAISQDFLHAMTSDIIMDTIMQ